MIPITLFEAQDIVLRYSFGGTLAQLRAHLELGTAREPLRVRSTRETSYIGLNFTIQVPDRVNGHPVTIGRRRVVELGYADEEEFRMAIRHLIEDVMTHEVGESIRFDGRLERDDHPRAPEPGPPIAGTLLRGLMNVERSNRND